MICKIYTRCFSSICSQATHIPIKKLKDLQSPENSSNTRRIKHFVDWKRVRVKAGNGGSGMISTASVYLIENAGPDGGNGGHGGHILFKAVPEVTCLNHLQSVILGKNGGSGRSRDCHGKNAPHSIVKVPLGTVIRNNDHEILGELKSVNSLFVGAYGGEGGKGNAHFKSSIRQTPMIAEIGGEGEHYTYFLELRTMAHFGLIGFPNAGKSTLLRAISRARPKVASYPFTTLNPHIGIVEYDDYTHISVADIPGIIPEAHKNKGLGISFLRHVERCLGLLYVIDLSQPKPWEQLEALSYELHQFSSDLKTRPFSIIGNKFDLKESLKNFEEFKLRISEPIFPISAKHGINITEILRIIRQHYDIHYYQRWSSSLINNDNNNNTSSSSNNEK